MAAVCSSFSTKHSNDFARSSLLRAYSFSELPFKPAILKRQSVGRREDALMLAGDFHGLLYRTWSTDSIVMNVLP